MTGHLKAESRKQKVESRKQKAESRKQSLLPWLPPQGVRNAKAAGGFCFLALCFPVQLSD
jgi:hypothetical protein